MFNSINGFAWYQYDFLGDKNNICIQHITI